MPKDFLPIRGCEFATKYISSIGLSEGRLKTLIKPSLVNVMRAGVYLTPPKLIIEAEMKVYFNRLKVEIQIHNAYIN